jgi:hypothetical protein
VLHMPELNHSQTPAAHAAACAQHQAPHLYQAAAPVDELADEDMNNEDEEEIPVV